MIYAAEALSLANPIFQRGWKISHGGEIDLHYDDIITAKRFGGLFLGQQSGYNGEIVSNADINRLRHNFQAFSKQGDLATGDNDPARAQAWFKELGIVSETGEVNWLQLEKSARYLQGVSARGGQQNFESLKAYLNKNFENTEHKNDESIA